MNNIVLPVADVAAELPTHFRLELAERNVLDRLMNGEWAGSASTNVPPLKDILPIFSKYPLECLNYFGVVPNRLGCACPWKKQGGRFCTGTLSYRDSVGISSDGSNDHLWRCNSKADQSCGNKSVSIFSGTILERSHLSPFSFLMLCYYWLAETHISQIQRFTGHGSSTITDWCGHIAQAVAYYQDVHVQKIGGPGKEVEVDESKFARRKYNRGHCVGDKSWVFVVVERVMQQNGKYRAGAMHAIPTMNRGAPTCAAFLRFYVEPGSKVFSDCWKGYRDRDIHQIVSRGMPRFTYDCRGDKHDGPRGCHQTVNHSENFKDPITGACTNIVEGCNNGLKIKIPRRHRMMGKIRIPLLVACWRRKYRGWSQWPNFWRAMAEVRYAGDVGNDNVERPVEFQGQAEANELRRAAEVAAEEDDDDDEVPELEVEEEEGDDDDDDDDDNVPGAVKRFRAK